MSNGNNYVIKLSDDSGATYSIEPDGQMEATFTNPGTLIDITNKSSGGNITKLEGVVVGKQVSWAANFVSLTDAGQTLIKTAAETGAFIYAEISTGIDGETWTGQFYVEGRSDSAALNDKVTMACTIASSGEYTYTAPSA